MPGRLPGQQDWPRHAGQERRRHHVPACGPSAAREVEQGLPAGQHAPLGGACHGGLSPAGHHQEREERRDSLVAALLRRRAWHAGAEALDHSAPPSAGAGRRHRRRGDVHLRHPRPDRHDGRLRQRPLDLEQRHPRRQRERRRHRVLRHVHPRILLLPCLLGGLPGSLDFHGHQHDGDPGRAADHRLQHADAFLRLLSPLPAAGLLLRVPCVRKRHLRRRLSRRRGGGPGSADRLRQVLRRAPGGCALLRRPLRRVLPGDHPRRRGPPVCELPESLLHPHSPSAAAVWRDRARRRTPAGGQEAALAPSGLERTHGAARRAAGGLPGHHKEGLVLEHFKRGARQRDVAGFPR
mmetsp:Transcript_16430/g.62419  ORF Transcript_16430/g.62419 Transcript_16430/m.62419 type:complete len:351 (+) Transcript_16430:622-1674(+)